MSFPIHLHIRQIRPGQCERGINTASMIATSIGASRRFASDIFASPNDGQLARLLRARASGHATAVPPSNDMNSRRCSGRDVRFIARPPHRSVRAAFPHTAPASGV